MDTKPRTAPPDDLYHLIYLPRGTERLERLGETKSFPKNYRLNEPGSVPTCCYIVKSGQVVGTESSAAGEERIYNLMLEGSLFLEECLLFDKVCPVTFRTLTDCELVSIGKCELKHAFKNDIDVVMDVCESLSTKFLSSMDQIRLGPRQNVSWKICRLLLVMAGRYGEWEGTSIVIHRKVGHQLIADILGLNRVTVSRKFKELGDLGLVAKSGRFYCIPDVDAMEDYMMNIELGTAS